MSFNAILVLFLVLAVIWGGVGTYSKWGTQSWSTLGFYLLFLLVLLLTHHIQL